MTSGTWSKTSVTRLLNIHLHFSSCFLFTNEASSGVLTTPAFPPHPYPLFTSTDASKTREYDMYGQRQQHVQMALLAYKCTLERHTMRRRTLLAQGFYECLVCTGGLFDWYSNSRGSTLTGHPWRDERCVNKFKSAKKKHKTKGHPLKSSRGYGDWQADKNHSHRLS